MIMATQQPKVIKCNNLPLVVHSAMEGNANIDSQDFQHFYIVLISTFQSKDQEKIINSYLRFYFYEKKCLFTLPTLNFSQS